MAWTIYKSSDVGAPTLTGQVGSLTTLLDAILTGPSFNGTGNAYGSTPCAGWTRSFTGTNKAVYRTGVGDARMYYRILDDGSLGLGAKEASLRGYETMSDVDTGTGPFPTVAQQTNGLQVPKSNTADTAVRRWFAAADSRSCIFFTEPNAKWIGMYFGEITSFKTTTDAYAAIVIGGLIGDLTTSQAANNLCRRIFISVAPATSFPALTGHYMCRSHDGTGGSIAVSKMTTSAACTDEASTFGTLLGFGALSKVNPADGGVYLCRLEVGYDLALRGALRGVSFMCHRGDSYTEFEPFYGTGVLTGKTFMAVPVYTPLAVLNVGLAAIETSDTVA